MGGFFSWEDGSFGEPFSKRFSAGGGETVCYTGHGNNVRHEDWRLG
jgi:hypothetical protein